MKYEQIRNLLDEPFRRLTGIKRQTFEKMVKILEEDDKKKKIKGGRKNKLSMENQLLMALEYIREYRTYFHIERPKKRVRKKKRVQNRNNKQKHFYSGKKKRHTLKSQIVVDKKTKMVICTSFSNGKKHDFRLFKESRVRWTKNRCGVTDSGYKGIQKLQSNTKLPKKSSKKKPLTVEENQQNRKISSERVLNENVIGCLKRFRILSDRYRNRRKRFGLRFNLIAGIYNFEVGKNGHASEGQAPRPGS